MAASLLVDDDLMIMRSRVRARRRRTRRLVARPVWSAAVVLGVLAVALGALVQTTPESRWERDLEPGEVFTAPVRVPLSGDLVVYGTPDGWRPSLEDMGCRTTDGGGSVEPADPASESHLVVGDEGLVPLVRWSGPVGHSIACSGPGAVAAAPLYVAPGHSMRHLIPVAAYSLAALLLPVGIVALVSTRPPVR